MLEKGIDRPQQPNLKMPPCWMHVPGDNFAGGGTCSSRFRTLEQAQEACLRDHTCGAVVKDGGLRCGSGGNHLFDLRKSRQIGHMHPTLDAWQLIKGQSSSWCLAAKRAAHEQKQAAAARRAERAARGGYQCGSDLGPFTRQALLAELDPFMEVFKRSPVGPGESHLTGKYNGLGVGMFHAFALWCAARFLAQDED